jgi:hypothetical protein
MDNIHLRGQKLDINSVFPNKFCINLDRRPERLEKVCAEFDKHGIENVMRFTGIDGKDLDYKGPLNAGQMGCTLSHLFLLEHARDNHLDSILIFEDDVLLSTDFNDRFNEAINELPGDWCMFYLGGNHFKGLQPYSDNLVRLKGTLTTHAFAIHSRFYDVAISTIRATLDQVIDVYFMILHSQYPCYCVHPKIAFQAIGFSDLEEREVDYTVLGN